MALDFGNYWLEIVARISKGLNCNIGVIVDYIPDVEEKSGYE